MGRWRLWRSRVETDLLLEWPCALETISVELETPSLVEQSPGDVRCDPTDVAGELARDSSEMAGAVRTARGSASKSLAEALDCSDGVGELSLNGGSTSSTRRGFELDGEDP